MQYWQYVGTIRFGFSSQRTANPYCVVEVTMINRMIMIQNKKDEIDILNSLIAVLDAFFYWNTAVSRQCDMRFTQPRDIKFLN